MYTVILIICLWIFELLGFLRLFIKNINSANYSLLVLFLVSFVVNNCEARR